MADMGLLLAVLGIKRDGVAVAPIPLLLHLGDPGAQPDVRLARALGYR